MRCLPSCLPDASDDRADVARRFWPKRISATAPYMSAFGCKADIPFVAAMGSATSALLRIEHAFAAAGVD